MAPLAISSELLRDVEITIIDRSVRCKKGIGTCLTMSIRIGKCTSSATLANGLCFGRRP